MLFDPFSIRGLKHIYLEYLLSWAGSVLTPLHQHLLYHIFFISLCLLYLCGALYHLFSLIYFTVKHLMSPLCVFFPGCVYLSSFFLFTTSSLPLSPGLHHIQLSKRVVVGRDGNLYFAHLTPEDSRDDYTCNVQYLATRTILAKEPITLTVTPCEFNFGSSEIPTFTIIQNLNQ